MKFKTKLIHSGEADNRFAGAINTPIFQSSTYQTVPGAEYHDIKYMRLSTSPNHVGLQNKLAEVAGTEAALVSGSGMSAISTALLANLRAGDHVLAQSTLYGGTHSLLTHDFPRWGIEVSLFDASQPERVKDLLRPNTKVLYMESVSNPLLEVWDFEAILQSIAGQEITSIIDNTFMSPVNFRPTEIGFDLSVHSASKYLNGHSDVIAGVILGSAEKVQVCKLAQDHLGASLDTHACYLLNRGLKTLGLRMDQHNTSAQVLAEFLDSHAKVEKVYYPGLSSHSPHHELAKKYFSGFGGMLSFIPRGGLEAANRVLESVQLAFSAASLGGVETLITRPSTTSHAGLTAEERSASGICDELVRVSVGIEDSDDLVADFEQALGKI